MKFEGGEVSVDAEAMGGVAEGRGHCDNKVRGSAGTGTYDSETAVTEADLADKGGVFREGRDVKEGGKKILSDAIGCSSEGAGPILPGWGAVVEREVVEDVR